MSWNNKVIWSEGMFLRPVHFQQHERHLQSLVRGSVGALRPYAWGLSDLIVDEELLAQGKFAIVSARGVFPDGTPFSIPNDEEPPAPLDIPDGAVDTRVVLALPVRRQHVEDAIPAERSDSHARYRYAEFEISDSNAGPHPAVTLQVGKLRLRLLLDNQDLGTMTVLALARICERKPEQQLVLDRSFIPACVNCQALPALHDLIEEVLGLLQHRAEVLGDRLAQPGTAGVAEIAHFLLLQTVNRFIPWFVHLVGLPNLHPVDLYAVLLQLSGELATFAHAGRRASGYPVYRHDDLQASFEPVLRDLRAALSQVIEQTAIPIALEERKFGVRVAVIDKELLRNAVFVLAVHARMAPEQLRNRFPAQVKLGPVERIRDLVNLALPGIALYPLPVAPRQVPYHAGYTYFELDRSTDHWGQLQTSGGFALHVAGDFPGLEIEFWALRS